MAKSCRRNALAAIALQFLFLAMSNTALAAGTVTNCVTFGLASGTLQAALAGGGIVTFACSGTIIVPEITIAPGTTSVDATGQSVTLSGNNTNPVFFVLLGATLNLTNLTIAHGSTAGLGGGIFNDGTLTVTNSTFSDNSSKKVGGGIFNDGMLTVTNGTFSGNTSTSGSGGGVFNQATLTVTNSTFSDNTATFGGGGIFNFATLTITNSTFSGNSASVGGGISNEGSATLKGTILAAESSGGNCVGSITDAGFNISDDGSCGFTQAPTPGGTSINNSTTLNLDPAGLQNNGGPTQTIAIEPNSQALNFIPVADCTDQSSPTPKALTQDQRGFPRPDPGNLSFCDAGAFELQTGSIVVLPGSERTQIARSTASSDSDQVNLAFTFADEGNPTSPFCDAGTEAFNGIDVNLYEGTCADLATATGGLLLDLSPFVVRTVGAETYGTLFQMSPTVPSPETVSVRMVAVPLLWEELCGEWTVNIEVAGLDTGAIGLGGGNPFALVVQDKDKNEGCFDITNAIVGNQLDPGRNVHREVRR